MIYGGQNTVTGPLTHLSFYEFFLSLLSRLIGALFFSKSGMNRLDAVSLQR
jgi:hypothetical protein